MDVGGLAEAIYDADRARIPIPPPSDRYPDAGGDAGYAVQEAWARLRVERDGATLVGRKIGATSRAIQELFDIDTPDFGHIFDDMVVPDGGTVRLGDLIQPMVEPELAFILGHDLRGPGVTPADALAAARAVVPCIEIIDSRIADWKIRFFDTVADNGSSGRCVFGPPVALPEDLAAVRAVMSRNGEAIGEATGEAVLGHPANAVAWLANALGEFGRGLESGQYVLSGSFMTAIRAQPGDAFEATFGGVGTVGCSFQ